MRRLFKILNKTRTYSNNYFSTHNNFSAMTTLQDIFRTYTKGPDMDGRTFVKLLKDVKIIDTKFSATDADLIFTKVKSKTSKKITFEQFQEGLRLVATRKNVDIDKVIEKILTSTGPILHGTVAEANKFHDDKSAYTGVHRYGGPTTVDKGRTQVNDLSEITDRSSYNTRGVKTSLAETVRKNNVETV